MSNVPARFNWPVLAGAVPAVYACLLVASLLLWQVENFYPSLWLDMVHDAIAASRLGGLEYLLAPHNEHVIATSRLLFMLDAAFGATGMVPVVAGYLLQLGVALALSLLAWRELAPRGQWQALACVAAVVALTLNGSQLMVLSWGLMVQHVLMNALTVAAALLVARLLRAPASHSTLAPEVALWCVTAVGLMTLGSAVALPLAALALALLCGAPWRRVCRLALLAALSGGVYLYVRGQLAEGLGTHWPGLFDLARFALAAAGGALFRGTPWPSADPVSPLAYPAALACGAVLAFVALAQALQFLRTRGSAVQMPLALVGLFLLLLTFGTGVAAGLSRLEMLGPAEALSQRYAVFSSMGWVGAVLVVAQWCSSAAVRWRRLAFIGVVLVALVLVHRAQNREERIFTQWSDSVWQGSLALLLEIDDRYFLNTLYPGHEELAEFSRRHLAPAGQGIFHLVAVRYGQHSALAASDLPECEGGLEVLVAVPADERAGAFDAPGTPYRFSGSSRQPGSGAATRDVLALDPDARVIGYGRATRPRTKPREGSHETGARWFGFLRATSNTVADFVARTGAGEACRAGVAEVRAARP